MCETGGDLVGVIHEVTGKPLAEIYSELREARYNQGMAPSTFIPKVVARPEKTPEEYRAILRNTWERGLAITEDSPVWKYLCHRVPGLRLDWLDTTRPKLMSVTGCPSSVSVNIRSPSIGNVLRRAITVRAPRMRCSY
ncbi:hypothetical protein D9M68_103720 [compost metagenome]